MSWHYHYRPTISFSAWNNTFDIHPFDQTLYFYHDTVHKSAVCVYLYAGVTDSIKFNWTFEAVYYCYSPSLQIK